MSLSTKLECLLGAEVAREVIDLVHSKDPMKKYLATEKGKAARKKSNKTFYEKHGRVARFESDTAEDVSKFLHYYVEDALKESKDTEFIDLNPILYRTASQMWKAFGMHTGSKVTRVRFLTLLPQLSIIPYIMRDGKKVYTPAYSLPVNEYYNEKSNLIN